MLYILMSPNYLKSQVREIKDFPIPGILFKDITPLLEDRASFRYIIESLAESFRHENIDKVAGIDARGFLFASGIAYLLNAGVVVVRKKGKLPYDTIACEHNLEYGKSALEIHKDTIKKGERIIIVDDVLATGGTAGAATTLIEQLGGIVTGLSFLIEVPLGGRELLSNYSINSLIKY